MIIAVDFDGTIVEHEFPAIGKEVPLAIKTMKDLQRVGHDLILWTVRIGPQLEDAYNYCRNNGIAFLGVNENPGQKFWNGSPKAYAQIYIDDAAFGCPLLPSQKTNGRPYVDWKEVRKFFKLDDGDFCECGQVKHVGFNKCADCIDE